MTRQRAGGVLLLALVLALCHCSLAVQLSISPGLERCVSEDGSVGDLVMLDYRIRPLQSPVIVTLTDPTGARIYDKTSVSGSDDDRSRYVYTSNRAGEYKVCFYNRDAYQSAITVDLDYRVGQSQQTADKDLAKKESLKPMESKLRQLETTANTIYNEMKTLQAKEDKMRDINDSTSRKVIGFSIASTALLLVLKGFEIIYLRNYFKARRMIQ